MKKIFILSIFLAALSSSCKKSSSGGGASTYYIKASMDGVAKTFNVGAMAVKFSSSGITSLSIVGSVSSAANLEGINIGINNSPSSKPIVAGTYSETSTTDFATGAVYNPGSATIVYGAGIYPSPTNPLTVIITAIDNNTVKGTFSGDFYYENTSTAQIGPAKKTFTNGSFYVKF